MGKRSTTENSPRKRGRGRPPGPTSRNKMRLAKVATREKRERRKLKSPKTVTESKNVSARIVMEGAEEYMQPTYQEGDVVLDVECGPNKAQMYLSKLCQGSKGPCIFFQGSWLTPNEFQYVSGRETAKDWKRSIRHQGKSMKLLLSKGILSVHSTMCECESCRVSVPVNRCRLDDKKHSPVAERRGRRLTTMVSLDFPREEVTESQESGSDAGSDGDADPDAEEPCPTDAVPCVADDVPSPTGDTTPVIDDKDVSDSDTIPASPPKLPEKHCSPLRESRLNNIIDQLRITKEKGLTAKDDPQKMEENVESPDENMAPANVQLLTDDDKYGGETEDEISDEEVMRCENDSTEVLAGESATKEIDVPVIGTNRIGVQSEERKPSEAYQVKETDLMAKSSQERRNEERVVEQGTKDVYTFDECDQETEKKVPPLVISIPRKICKRQREGKLSKLSERIVRRKEHTEKHASEVENTAFKKEQFNEPESGNSEKVQPDIVPEEQLQKSKDDVETIAEKTTDPEFIIKEEAINAENTLQNTNEIIAKLPETIQTKEEILSKPMKMDTELETTEKLEEPFAEVEGSSELKQTFTHPEENVTVTEIETVTTLTENSPIVRAQANVHTDSASVRAHVNTNSDSICMRAQADVHSEAMSARAKTKVDERQTPEVSSEVKNEENKVPEKTLRVPDTAKRQSPTVTPKHESSERGTDNRKTDSKSEDSNCRKSGSSDGKYSDYMRLLAATHAQPTVPFLPPGMDPFFSLRAPDGPLAPGLFNPYHMLLGHPGLVPKDSAYLPTSTASSGISPPCVSPLLMAPRLPFGLPPPMFDLSRPVPFLPVSESIPFTCTSGSSTKRGPPEGDTALDLSTKHMKFDYHNSIINATKLHRNSDRHSKQNFGHSQKEHRHRRQNNDISRKSQSDIKYSPTTAKHLQSWIDQASKRAQSTCRCAANNPNDIRSWPVDRVVQFLSGVDGCSAYSENFREQRVDGKTLPFLTTDHLMRNLGMKLGPALALSEAVAEKVREISKSNWSCDHCRKKPSVYVDM